MSANSEEWETGMLDHIAKQCVKTANMVFMHQAGQMEPDMYRLLDHLTFSLCHAHTEAVKIKENYIKRKSRT